MSLDDQQTICTSAVEGGVHIHSIWRTSSTYIWEKFRACERVCGFYEPFHTALAYMTPANARGEGAAKGKVMDKATLGHPGARPYWIEYEGVVGDGVGAPFYDLSYAEKLYFPKGNRLEGKQKEYLTNLVQYAKSNGKIACLGYVRSCMRVGHIKAALGGVHIALIRNPFYQFMSYSKQWGFLDDAEATVAFMKPKVWTFYKNSADHLHSSKYWSGSAERRAKVFDYAFFYVLSHVVSLAYADFIIDVDVLATDADHRRQAEKFIRDRVGLDIDFSDSRESVTTDLKGAAQLSYVRCAMEEMLERLSARCPDGLMRIVTDETDSEKFRHAITLIGDKIKASSARCYDNDGLVI
jgi:hypothetical protein